MPEWTSSRRIVAILATTVILTALSPALHADEKPTSLDTYVKTAVAAELDALEKSHDFDAVATRLDALFDQVIAVGSDKNLDAFRNAAFARRLVHQLQDLPEDQRLDTLQFFRAHDTLARTFVFMIDPPSTTSDSPSPNRRYRRTAEPANPYAVLRQLRENHADELDKFANLATAICVVHDRPFSRQINENATTSPPAADIFDYYVTNEKHMLFGIKNVPAELLVYVVDTTASIADMKWALAHYAGDQAIGRHFFDVQYDYDNFRSAREKKVTAAGYTLPHILQYGGVCADQAFFAMSIGKAIGVPTAYTTAQSGEVGHAWVGFLQARGDKGAWNFDTGRYPAYRGIRGNVLDPQTRRQIPDGYVSLLAELIGRKPADRQSTTALADAAARISSDDFKAAPIPVKLTDAQSKPRAAGAESALELLEIGLKQNAGNPRAWMIVRDLAKDGKLTLAQKIKWSNAVMKLCGEKYPDFAAALLEPMIATIEDPKQQIQIWDAAFNQFQSRQDLGAEIRMRQAKVWEAANEPAKAGKCYEEVIARYANAGPFVIPAVAGCEKLLAGKEDKILKLYEQTWAKTQKPEGMAGMFMMQSNWFKVGTMYAEHLKAAGQSAKADTVMGQLGVKNAAGGG
jgi:hypothetical protein